MNADQIARAAGFRKTSERSVTNSNADHHEWGDMRIISEPIMPEGWFSLRTDKGAMCVGRTGCYWVPFLTPPS